MTDPLKSLPLKMSKDTTARTSSLELPAGITLSTKQDGKMDVDLFGREVVPASRLALPEKERERMTKDTSGPSGCVSYEPVNQKSSSENKSMPSVGEKLVRKKVCRLCGDEKPYSEFYINSKGKHHTACKECFRKRRS